MKLVFAQNAHPLSENNKPDLVIGSYDDLYRFKRKWVLACSPRLHMDEGDSQQDWATFEKILSGISWNLKIILRMRRTPDTDKGSCSANIFVETDNVACLNQIRFQQLFHSTLAYPAGTFTIKIGNSLCLTTNEGIWSGSIQDDAKFNSAVSSFDYKRDVKLTWEEAQLLMWTKDSDILFTYSISLQWMNPSVSVMVVSRRILETGEFSDCKIISREGGVTSCHKAIVMESSSKLKREIDHASSQLKLKLSGKGTVAFLRFLYYNELEEAKKDSNLALELLVAAGLYGVPTLWKGISKILLENDLDAETACKGFEILVKLKWLGQSEVLAHKFVAVSIKGSGPPYDKSSLKKSLKDKAVMDAWLEILPHVTEVNWERPRKLPRLELPDSKRIP